MTTMHRQYLDQLLSKNQPIIKGDVLDIGGKKENKRGTFRPSLSQVKAWHYVNIDGSTNPDFCGGAENIPVKDASYDTALLSEVIEHLENPEIVLKEVYRILRNDGTAIISVPFLFPVHADPFDFQRWTDRKMRTVLEATGFVSVEITSLGNVGAVMHDLLLVARNKHKNRYLRLIILTGLWLTKPIFHLMESLFKSDDNGITSGYFITAKKVK